MKQDQTVFRGVVEFDVSDWLICHQAPAGEGAKLADFYLTKLPAPAPVPSLTLDQAMKIQAEFNEAIAPVFGRWSGTRQV